MAGFCDIEQRLCLGLALWNGRDPILKERMFGLTGAQAQPRRGRQGVLVVPRRACPATPGTAGATTTRRRRSRTRTCIAENGRRGKFDPEYELLDTGVFDDDRYWIVEVDYAKADPDRRAHGRPGDQRRTRTATRCTSCRPRGSATPGRGTSTPPSRSWRRPATARSHRPPLPRRPGAVRRRRARRHRAGRCCSARTRPTTARLYGAPPTTPYPKDGINDHVIHGAATVNPDRRGTKARSGTGWRCRRARPASCGCGCARPGPAAATAALGQRLRAVDRRSAGAEADEFYAELTPAGGRPTRRWSCGRRSPGMLWSKQLYYYDVRRWLEGDPTQPTAARGPPATGRNAHWRNFDAFDIMSMPDKWEYPWFAAWDLAFHCVALAHVDPAFAKYQLILLCREWFQHPNGALPAYEWDFGDVNPPVQAWAALEVFAIDGGRDLDFLSRIFDKLLVNFTWWVNREDAERQQPVRGRVPRAGQHRPARPLPPAGRRHAGAVRRHRLDGVLRAGHGGHRRGAAPQRAAAGRRPGAQVPRPLRRDHRRHGRPGPVGRGRWALLRPAGHARTAAVPVKVRSMVGVIPMLAAVVVDEYMLERALTVGKRFADFLERMACTTGTSSARAACCVASRATGGCCSAWSASTG